MKYFTKGLVIFGQSILWLFFTFNIFRLYEKYLSIKDSLSRDILAVDSAKLLEAINSSNTPVWLWVISILFWLVTTALLIGWLIPRLRKLRWFWLVNWIWLVVWLIYFAISIIALIVAFNRLV